MEIEDQSDLVFLLFSRDREELASIFVDSFKGDPNWKNKLRSKHFCQFHLQAFIYALYDEKKLKDAIDVLQDWLINDKNIDFVPNSDYNEYITQIFKVLPSIVESYEKKNLTNTQLLHIAPLYSLINKFFEKHNQYEIKKLNKTTWIAAIESIYAITDKATMNTKVIFYQLFSSYYLLSLIEEKKSAELLRNFLVSFTKDRAASTTLVKKFNSFLGNLFKEFFSFPKDLVKRRFVVHAFYVTREYFMNEDKGFADSFFQASINTIINDFSNLEDNYLRTFNLDFFFEIFTDSIFTCGSYQLDQNFLADQLDEISNICSLVSLGQFDEKSKWYTKFMKYLIDKFDIIIIPNFHSIIQDSPHKIENLDLKIANLVARKPEIALELLDRIVILSELSASHWIYTLINYLSILQIHGVQFMREMHVSNKGKESSVDMKNLKLDLQSLIYCAMTNRPEILCTIACAIGANDMTRQKSDAVSKSEKLSCMRHILMLAFSKQSVTESTLNVFSHHIIPMTHPKSEPYLLSSCLTLIELSFNSTSLFLDPVIFSGFLQVMSPMRSPLLVDLYDLTVDTMRTIPTDPEVAHNLLSKCNKIRTYSVCHNSLITFGESEDSDKYVVVIRGISGIKAFELKDVPPEPKSLKVFEETKKTLVKYEDLGLDKKVGPFDEFPHQAPFEIKNKALSFLLNISAFHNVKYIENPDFTEYDKLCQPIKYKISFVPMEECFPVVEEIGRLIKRTSRAQFEIVNGPDDNAVVSVVFCPSMPGHKHLMDEKSRKIFVCPCGTKFRALCNARFADFERNDKSRKLNMSDIPMRLCAPAELAEFIRIYTYLALCTDGYEPEKKLPRYAEDLVAQYKRRREEMMKMMDSDGQMMRKDVLVEELEELPKLF